MIFWAVLAFLLLLALFFVATPLMRGGGPSRSLLASIVAIVAVSAGLYYFTGAPGVPSGAGTAPDIDEMVESLAKRLERNPEDVNGWLMLGRSYQTQKDYDRSIDAYETAMSLEDGQNSQTLVSLALVILEQQDGGMSGRATSLLENALALEPNNPNALFYSGFAAAARGDTDLAADRWEMLMGLNAPPEIRELLQQKVNEWRGVTPATTGAEQAEAFGDVIDINLSVAEAATAELQADATVFIIARDPKQPSPPVAVTRRQLSELPATVSLSDRDSMVPGRSISMFGSLEVVARISKSGQPLQQPGDWFASIVIDNRATAEVSLSIDQQVE